MHRRSFSLSFPPPQAVFLKKVRHRTTGRFAVRFDYIDSQAVDMKTNHKRVDFKDVAHPSATRALERLKRRAHILSGAMWGVQLRSGL